MGAKLTDREREVMRLLKQRLTTKQIAARLGLSPVTVRRHISSSVRKLEAGNRAAAALLLAALYVLASAALATPASAQTVHTFSGVLRDRAGSPVANQQITLL